MGDLVAGVIGVVGRCEPDTFDTAMSLLMHDTSFEPVRLVAQQSLQLGVVQRPNAPATLAWRARRRAGVVVYGAPLPPMRSGVVPAREILERYLQGGTNALTELDGGFTVVVLDVQSRRLVIMNDRMATHTVQFAHSDGTFAFAPEAKAVLRTLARHPELDMQGCVEFLTRGIALRDHTLFAGVRLLPPASVLSVDLDDASFRINQYWHLHFSPRSQMRTQGEAVEVVHDTLRGCVEAAVRAVPDGHYDLLMTGGLDSRTVLAMGVSLGCPPRRTMTWGVADDIDGSDPAIARELAAMYEVRHTFVPYDHDGFERHAQHWAFISELGSDNLGNFAAGAEFLSRVHPMASAVFNGDQVLGFGGLPVSLDDAIEAGAGIPADGLAPGIASLFGKRATDVAQMVRGTLDALLDGRQTEPLKNVLDFLGWHTHGVRWLNAPMYHREPMVSHWRPMVHRPALELFAELPEWARIDKVLLPRVLDHHYPAAARVPVASANSLVDWNMAFTRELPTCLFFARQVGAGRVLESPVGQLLEPDHYRAVIRSYLATSFAEVDRRPSSDAGIRDVRRRFARSRAASLAVRRVQRWVNRMRRRRVGASTARVVQRVALIELLIDAIDRGWFAHGPNASSPSVMMHLGAIWNVDVEEKG